MKSFFKKILNFVFYKRKKCVAKKYYKRFKRNSFVNGVYKNQYQYEAQIIKMYHSIEKGLAYSKFRAGFGRQNVDELVSAMENYSREYDIEAFFYKTALSVLKEYIAKNELFGYVDNDLKNKIESLKGTPNKCGGVINYEFFANSQYESYDEFVYSRHSIREFSDVPVEIERIKEALALAQYTPSACNRQGWKTRIVVDKDKIKKILANQNGNRGFGENIDKLLVITSDIRYFSKDREIHQPFIDGGMYAMNVLHALHSKNIATIPLSASLRDDQEEAVRECIKLDDAEVLILFIGIGNYLKEVFVTKSERHESRTEII